MKFLKLLPFFFMIFGVFPYTNNLFAGNEDPNNYKVLTSSNKKLSISNVEAFLTEGDKLINTGEFEKAKELLVKIPEVLILDL